MLSTSACNLHAIFFLQDLLPFGKCIHHTPWQAIQKEQNVLDPRDEHVLSILCF